MHESENLTPWVQTKQNLWGRFKHFWHTHERHAEWIAFASGVTWDNIMLRRIDVPLDNIFFATHFSITFIGILLYNMFDARALRGKNRIKFADWLPFFIQFSFGGLFSSFFVFYSRSASFVSSWPFVLCLVVMLFLNEKLRHRYSQLTFQVCVFFFVSLSYFTFLIPLVLHSMGPAEFILSGVVAIGVLFFMLWLLHKTAPERYHKSRPLILGISGAIYIVFNVLYFTNIIPPIPLSLKQIGIYHVVLHNSDGSYSGAVEDSPWYDLAGKLHPVYHDTGNEPVYVYTSVFSPTNLNTTVFHQWSYYDPAAKTWVVANRIPYPVTGGAYEGYRGYSYKENVTPGLWRVEVVTGRNQLLGRVVFTIVETPAPKPLKMKTL